MKAANNVLEAAIIQAVKKYNVTKDISVKKSDWFYTADNDYAVAFFLRRAVDNRYFLPGGSQKVRQLGPRSTGDRFDGLLLVLHKPVHWCRLQTNIPGVARVRSIVYTPEYSRHAWSANTNNTI